MADRGYLRQRHDPVKLPVCVGNALGPGDEAEIFLRGPVRVERGDFRQIAQAFLGPQGLVQNVYAVDFHGAAAGGEAAG